MFVSQIYKEASKILGTSDEEVVFEKLTQTVQALMESGWWFHTKDEIDICTGWDGCTVTLPKEIEVPLAVNVDGSPCYFRGRTFQYHINKGGQFNPATWAWDDRGFHATMVQMREPSELVAVAELQNDAGKTLRVLGQTKLNRTLRTQLPDGTNVDGLIVPIHYIKDFPAGVIVPDGATVSTRQAVPTPLIDFSTTTPHGLVTGALVELSVEAGTLPSPLQDGGNYFIGVVDSTTLRLYVDRSSSLQSINAVRIVGFLEDTVLKLTDTRQVQAVTQIVSAVPHNATIASRIIFEGNPLAVPLADGTTYFANPLTPTTLQIYGTADDATNRVNPIYLSDEGTDLKLRVLRTLSPSTLVVTSVDHDFLTGNAVTGSNSGGALPKPLISGVSYYVHVIDSRRLTLHQSVSEAATGENAIAFTDAGSGSSSLVKLLPATVSQGTTANVQATGHGLSLPSGSGASATAVIGGPVANVSIDNQGSSYETPPIVSFAGGGGTGAQAVAVVAAGKVTAINILNGGSNYTSNPTVSFSGGGGTGAQASAQRTLTNVVSISVTGGGTGYDAPPNVKIEGGGGTGATAVANISGGAVTSITMITKGTGYTTVPTVTILSSSGSYVQFSSSGALPAPITSGTVYRAEGPMTPNSFTLKNTDFSEVNITSLGSGSLFLVLSRTFAIGFNDQWKVDTTSLSTGDGIYFSTQAALPTTSPSIDQDTQYFVRVIGVNLIEIYDTAPHASNLASTTGRISVQALGSGDLFLAIQNDVTVGILNTKLAIEFNGYIASDTIVKFTTNGTLPEPLSPTSSYRVAVVDGFIEVRDTDSIVIPITGVGNGDHQMVIERLVSPDAATEVVLPQHQIDTGNQLSLRPDIGDMPTPLTPDQVVFARRIDQDHIELYATASQAENLNLTAGRIDMTSVGDTLDSVFLIDRASAPTIVSKVDSVEKPKTQGFVSLYAWDRRRSNDLTLIGQYHPNEVDPRYRRIRVGTQAAWVRILYRVKCPKIESQYDYIPLEQTRAVLMGLRAVKLEDDGFAPQAKNYMDLAGKYLSNQDEAMEGHAPTPIQVADTYGHQDDIVIQ